jgi:hypothetical protein
MKQARDAALFHEKKSFRGLPATADYTMLWLLADMPRDIAVNELKQGASQRFGRDSFGSRSTA